jgi:hypothetical protein
MIVIASYFILFMYNFGLVMFLNLILKGLKYLTYIVNGVIWNKIMSEN